ncbi:MAG: bis(5'-nucleosyl)-tetraphosphatase (symmetrical) YqeK [Lachnospiraceae bacterium]
MKIAETKKIQKILSKELDKKRYEHTLGVAYTASCLAMCYGENIQDAKIAGLLHDCAKCMDDKKKKNICLKHGIPINEAETENPFLLHAKVGSFLAMHKYHIKEQHIIDAILNHTTGRPNMTMLDKIIYVADYIEPSRTHAQNLPEIRALAFHNLDEALFLILEDTLSYLNLYQNHIDPMTKNTYEFYKQLRDKKEGV